MSNSKVFLAIGAMLVATFVMGAAVPAYASPVGTTFGFQSLNFQGTGADPAIPFGTPTFVPGSNVTVSSSVTNAYAPIPGFVEGGNEFVEFTIDTHTAPGNSGYLQSSLLDPSQWLISGLNCGAGTSAFTGVIFVSFDIDGVPLALNDPNGLGVPIVPNPATGALSVPITVDPADPIDFIPWDPISLVGIPLHTILVNLSNLTLANVQTVNSMHVGFEVKHIPEPASIMMLGTGLASVLVLRRRKR